MLFKHKPKKLLTFMLFSSTALFALQVEAGQITINDAISRTLSQHTEIQIKKSEVSGAKADLQATEGDFDLGLTGAISGEKSDTANFNITTGNETEVTTRTQSYQMGLSKKFENSLEVDFENTIGASRTATSSFETIGSSDWSITLTLPLLQGAGSDVTTATKRAAQRTLEATRFASAHDISKQVYSTIAAYWTSLEAAKNFKNLEITMTRASETAQTLQERQQGGELAGVEYQRSLAELRLREVDLETGRQAKYESQETLAVAIGNNTDDDLPEAVGDFPKPASDETLEKLDQNKLLKLALHKRHDVIAQQKIIEAAKIDLMKSKDNTLPSLDLALKGGYTAAISQFSSGKAYDLYDNAKERNGPDYSVGLTFSYPLGNNAAYGAMKGSRETINQEKLTLEQLHRSIRNEINVSVDKLKAAVRSYKLSSQSLELMQEVAVETSRRLNSGESSMTDMISVEDRLTEGRLRIIESLSDYAKALAELRFVTGTLATGHDENLTFNAENLNSLPLLELESFDG